MSVLDLAQQLPFLFFVLKRLLRIATIDFSNKLRIPMKFDEFPFWLRKQFENWKRFCNECEY